MRILFYIILFNLVFANYSIIQSESEIEYFGKHPMHSFSGRSSSVALLSDCNDSQTKCDLEFKVPIISLNSGNDNRDNNMLNHLNAFSHPQIIMSFEDFLVKEYDKEITNVKININGISQEIQIPLNVSIVSENNYLATSTFVISLSEFNIELPELLFASIDNNIRIQVKLLIENH